MKQKLEGIILEKNKQRTNFTILFSTLMFCANIAEGENSLNNRSLNIIEKQKNCPNNYLITEKYIYFYGKVIKGVDIKSFSCIKDEYSKDKNYIYFGLERIKKADTSTFIVLQYGYSKDKNHVYFDYYSGKVIYGADPKSFEVLDDLVFSKDKNAVYIQYELGKIKIIKNADPQTFKKLGDTGCFSDKNHIYSMTGDVLPFCP